MKHIHYSEIKPEVPNMEQVKDVKVRWLISKKDGAENFAMRLFQIEPEGYTPFHKHKWEHEVFILGGTGVLKSEVGTQPLQQGEIIFIKPLELHQFINEGTDTLKFLCLIPIQKNLNNL